MNSRDLIIIAVTIILLLFIGSFALFNSHEAQATMLTMTSSSILNEGDSLVLRLSDDNGTSIENQKIQINLTNPNGVTENFTLKTNSDWTHFTCSGATYDLWLPFRVYVCVWHF